MDPASSLLLSKEGFLLDSENDIVRTEESEKFLADAPDVNAISVRKRDCPGNDT